MSNLFLDLLNKFEFFKKPKEEEYCNKARKKIEVKETLSRMELLNMIELGKFRDLDYTPNDQPILLVVDDMELSKVIYDSEFMKIKNQDNRNISTDFNLVWAIGANAGYEALKFVKNNKVDYALIDITLGNPIKLSNGEYIEVDGIDISRVLLDNNPNAKFLFSTAHTFKFDSPTTAYYRNKMIELNNIDLLKSKQYLSFKNTNQIEDIENLLYGEIK